MGRLQMDNQTPSPVISVVRDPMPHTSCPIRMKARLSTTVACVVFATCALLFGCQPMSPPTPGGDSPVTTQRLSGTRLTDIREPLSWSFTNSTVVIENEGQPIPADVVDALLGDGSAPVRIEASWRLDEVAGTLRLTGMKTDQASIDKEVTIPIAPAGHVRANLGSRQYNFFRDRVSDP